MSNHVVAENVDLTSKFEENLLANAIPPRPMIMERVMDELAQPEPDLKKIERELLSDVAIAAVMVKTANSPYFGVRKRVSTIREALLVMGTKLVAHAVTCAAFRAAFPGVNLERFWEGSEQVAHLSAWLATSFPQWKIPPESAYTFGLFRDSGIAVMAVRIPGYQRVLASANMDGESPFPSVEARACKVSHTQVGAMLAETWGLPEVTVEAIRNHHDPKAIEKGWQVGIPFGSGVYMAIAQLAEYLFQQKTGLSQTKEWQKLGQACKLRLNLQDDDIDRLLQDMPLAKCAKIGLRQS